MEVNVNVIEVIKESWLKTVSILGRDIYSVFYLENDSNLGKSYVRKTATLKYSKHLEKELRTMLRFHTNPFIIRALSDHLHFKTTPKGVDLCYIYMEYASLGNLKQMISAAGGKLPEGTVRRATRMILQGLKALHSQGIVHCDLKPSNILVFPSNSLKEPWLLKLSGLGLCKEPFIDPDRYFHGTREYMPPEGTDRFMFVTRNRLVGPTRDTWSLGRTVLHMFGAIPFVEQGSFTWKLYGDISPMAQDFLRRCLTECATDRANVDELLEHPFAAEKLPFYLSFLRVPSFIRKMVNDYLRNDEMTPKPRGLDW